MKFSHNLNIDLKNNFINANLSIMSEYLNIIPDIFPGFGDIHTVCYNLQLNTLFNEQIS
jgi:hypothetical protein